MSLKPVDARCSTLDGLTTHHLPGVGLVVLACEHNKKAAHYGDLVQAVRECLSLLNDPEAEEDDANKLIQKLNAVLVKVES